jgi:trehalose 6-phosphate synthase/phosphatase
MTKPRLIVASARLPVTVSRRHDAWEVATSTGGLVTALKAVAERRTFTWLGWPGTYVPEADRAEVTRELARHGSAPVYIGKSDIDGFYLGFSNRQLWPLFHNLTDRSHFGLSGYKSYEKVNEMFADAICELARPGDVIWVHDYQLALVPELVRRRGAGCPIGFFLHIPFPSAETYRTLPVREEILRGMLGADLIGFHTYEYVSHFRNACLRVLGLESEPSTVRVGARRCELGVLPIGIDPVEIREMSESREARQELASLQSTYAGKKIIVGVDRLDYTKGIPQKLLAFEELLRAHPKWRQRVVLIQIAAPSRTDVDEYQQLKRQVDELVGRINGRYGSSSSMPVVYVNQSVPRARLVGLYESADIALVTPVRDGMNLVALEYVVARGERGGTLILSEFAGAAHCLPGARLVSPYHITQVAGALAESLEAGAPSDAFRHMLKFANENTSMVWANRFLDRLEATAIDLLPPVKLLELSEPPLVDRVDAAEQPLVLLDYDGTLRSYVVDPREAVPDERILSVLDALSRTATVYVVSGRSADVLDAWLGALPIGLVSEHGLSVKHPGGAWERRPGVSGTALKRLVEPLFQDFLRRTPGSAIEYKDAAIAWHYRAVDPEFGTFQANELLTLLEDNLKRRPYTVLRGSRVIEVRHESITKGQAVLALLERYARADFLFCAGDDRTDEEMMEAIPDAWRPRAVTCWVGMRNPRASYWVDSNRALLDELDWLSERWQERAADRGQGTGKAARRAAEPKKSTGRSGPSVTNR